MNKVIVDVRESDEFKSEHVADAVHIPLSQLAHQAPGMLKQLKGKEVTIMCHSGRRAQLAKNQLENMGFDCVVYEGGIEKWKANGLPTVKFKGKHLAIMRQVQMIAGSLVVIGVAGGFYFHPGFYGLAAFVGAGLMFAGASGICMMAELLGKAPWNKNVEGLQQELCQASPNAGHCPPGEESK